MISPCPCRSDQSHMPRMKRTHGRHHRHCPGEGRPCETQVLQVTDRLHGLCPSLMAGKRITIGGGANEIKGRGPNTKVMNPMHAHKIVFANEKGGTGKSTTAVHAAVALCAAGFRVAAIDMDVRQKTLVRYLDNRAATMGRRALDLPIPVYGVLSLLTPAGIEQDVARLGHGCDYVIVDTPGRDDALSRAAIALADTLVTPINDSFVDLDLIGQVDAETFKVIKPSFYAELIWDLRKVRAKTDGGSVDWVVLRNRLQHLEAHNMRRVGAALTELSKRVGFRVIPGLGERVIYRELFPKGLTLLDVGAIESVGLSHIAARQELREMVSALALPAREDALPQLAFS